MTDAHELGKRICRRLSMPGLYARGYEVRAEEIAEAGIPDEELSGWARELGLEVQPPLLPGMPYVFMRAR